MRYKIETNKSKISGPIYHELALVCVYHDRETTDNFRVAVIYFRFWIVYTCGIINLSRQMSVCVWLSTMCVSHCLSLCPCVCVAVSVPFRIIIMCAQMVHVYMYNYVHYVYWSMFCRCVMFAKVNKRRRRKWKQKKATNQATTAIPTSHPPTHWPQTNPRTKQASKQLSKHQALTSWPKTQRAEYRTQRTSGGGRRKFSDKVTVSGLLVTTPSAVPPKRSWVFVSSMRTCHTHTQKHTHTHTHAHANTQRHTHIIIGTHTYPYTHKHTHTHTYIYTHTHSCTHARTHIHTGTHA